MVVTEDRNRPVRASLVRRRARPGRFAGALYTRGKRFITRYFVAWTGRAATRRARAVGRSGSPCSRFRSFGSSALSGQLRCRPWPSRRRRRPTATSRARSGMRPARSLPGVTVTVTNTDTGTRRVVVTNEQGFYRAPLLPLGAYTLTAELQGFSKFEQRGLTLSAPGRPSSSTSSWRSAASADPGRRQQRVAGRAAGPHRPRPDHRRGRDPATCRSSRATPTTSRSCRPTSPATRTTSSACRASTPTARRCTRTTSSTATPTPRRTAPACACCRCPKCWCAK